MMEPAKKSTIFEILDDDNSGSIDADELCESSEVLGFDLKHIADSMSASDSLTFEDFFQIVDNLFTDELHESAGKVRAMKESYVYLTYERLRRKDGSFTLGCFRKSLDAIGLSLRKKERLALFRRHLLPQDMDGGIAFSGASDIESGSTKGIDGAQNVPVNEAALSIVIKWQAL